MTEYERLGHMIRLIVSQDEKGHSPHCLWDMNDENLCRIR